MLPPKGSPRAITLHARQWNEAVKSLSTIFQNLGIAFFVTGVLEPSLQTPPTSADPIWFVLSAFGFILSPLVFCHMVSEN